MLSPTFYVLILFVSSTLNIIYIISFTFQGSKVTIMGQNGAGKSSIIKLLNGSLQVHLQLLYFFKFLILLFFIYKTLSINMGNNYVNKLPFTTTNWTTDYHFLLTRDSKTDISLLFYFKFKRISAYSKKILFFFNS